LHDRILEEVIGDNKKEKCIIVRKDFKEKSSEDKSLKARR